MPSSPSNSTTNNNSNSNSNSSSNPSSSSETLYSIFSRAYPPPPPTSTNQPSRPTKTTPNTTMTELSFAKTFLSTLDARPLKLQPDHVSNPKTLSLTNNGPYTLPKMPTAFKRPPPSTSPSTSTTEQQQKEQAQSPKVLTVTLKSTRNPVLSLTLPGTELGVTVLELKGRVAAELKLENGTEKVRVLFRKKPVGDVKTVGEIVGSGGGGEGEGGEVELGVMVMGYNNRDEGTTTTTTTKDDVVMNDADAAGAQQQQQEQEKPRNKVAQGPSGEEVLGEEAFWADLKGFLVQRIRDEGTAGEVFEKFRGSWGKR